MTAASGKPDNTGAECPRCGTDLTPAPWEAWVCWSYPDRVVWNVNDNGAVELRGDML